MIKGVNANADCGPKLGFWRWQCPPSYSGVVNASRPRTRGSDPKTEALGAEFKLTTSLIQFLEPRSTRGLNQNPLFFFLTGRPCWSGMVRIGKCIRTRGSDPKADFFGAEFELAIGYVVKLV
jgi:hypothetical protein